MFCVYGLQGGIVYYPHKSIIHTYYIEPRDFFWNRNPLPGSPFRPRLPVNWNSVRSWPVPQDEDHRRSICWCETLRSPNSAMKVPILQYYQDYQQPQFFLSCHNMSLWHNKSQRCVCFYWFSHIPTSWLWAVSLGPQAMLDPWLPCLSGIAFGFLPKALRYLAQAKGWRSILVPMQNIPIVTLGYRKIARTKWASHYYMNHWAATRPFNDRKLDVTPLRALGPPCTQLFEWEWRQWKRMHEVPRNQWTIEEL